MRYKFILIGIFLTVFIWSAIKPHDYFTWFLEVFPAIIGLITLLLTHRSFEFTRLLYTLICIHAIILCIGGHYTYALEPFFEWIKTTWDLERNNYDKLGHFAQGFIPAMIAREIFIRKNIIQHKKWINFFAVTTALSISAVYELLEWLVAEFSGESAEAFLGTQGYVWDTQTDMALALSGGVLASILLTKIHNKQIEKII